MLQTIKNLLIGRPKQTKTEAYVSVSGSNFLKTEQEDIALKACIRILADALSVVDYSLYNADRTSVSREKFYKCLRVKANKHQNAVEFWKYMESCRLYHGNAYAYIKWGKAGILEELIPLDPTRIEIKINSAKEFYETDVKYVYTDPVKQISYTIHPDEILHFKANSRNGIVGVGAKVLLREVLNTNAKAEANMKAAAENGFGGILQFAYPSNLNTEKQKAFLEKINSVLASSGERKLALPAEFDVKLLGQASVDGGVINIRDKGVKRIAGFFGVPLYMLSEDNGSGTGAMTSTQSAAFYNHVLAPIINQYCCELTDKLLPRKDSAKGTHFEDEDIFGFRYLSPNEKTDNYCKLSAAGLITANEARAELGFEKYQDDFNSGDKLYRNGAFVTADNGDSTQVITE